MSNRTSSINLKPKISTGALAHNDRSKDKNPAYIFAELSENNEYDFTAQEAKNNIDNLYLDVTKDRQNIRTTDKKSSICEFVCVTNQDTNFEDLRKLSKHIEQKFGFTGVQISHHKDEGHIDKNSNMQVNYHAHLTFFTLATEQKKDIKIGQQLNRLTYLDKNSMRELQTETAKILKMQRGNINSKTQRLEHNEYRAVAKIKAEKTSEKEQLKQLKEEIKKERLELQKHKAKRADYAELEEKHKRLQAEIKNNTKELEQIQEQVQEKHSINLNNIKQAELITSARSKEIVKANTNLVGKVNKEHLEQDIKAELDRAYNTELKSTEEQEARVLYDIASRSIEALRQKNTELTETLKTQSETLNKYKIFVQDIGRTLKSLGFYVENRKGLSFNLITTTIQKTLSYFKEPLRLKREEISQGQAKVQPRANNRSQARYR